MYARIAITAVVFSVGWWLGDRLASGRYEAELHATESAARIAQDAAIAAAREELEAESRRAVQAAEARGRRSVAAQEVINEIHVAPDSRDCEWTPEQRLRIEKLYAIYGADPNPTAP